jgi:hypothetical protein
MRPRQDLVLENLLLRHQLAVLTRPTRRRLRTRLRTSDKLLWLLARRFCRDGRQHLVFVTPDTVVRWHRQGWRLFWRWKSRSRGGRPHLSAEFRELIANMPRDNHLWGTERIRGELLKWPEMAHVSAQSRAPSLGSRPVQDAAHGRHGPDHRGDLSSPRWLAAGDRVGRARVLELPPRALLARLERRLSVLTDGSADLPERQQTLRATAVAAGPTQSAGG